MTVSLVLHPAFGPVVVSTAVTTYEVVVEGEIRTEFPVPAPLFQVYLYRGSFTLLTESVVLLPLQIETSADATIGGAANVTITGTNGLSQILLNSHT
jgi:hypothetical protein